MWPVRPPSPFGHFPNELGKTKRVDFSPDYI
jgi:hypothetical protein